MSDKSFNNLKTDTVVIGAGQAGIATSEHLSDFGIPHVVLEKNRIAEAWRTRRWDSLVANGPCWHDRFPNLEFEDDGEAFVHHDKVADYFEKYAKKINAPVHTGIEVLKVTKKSQDTGYLITTNQGTIEAKNVVVATGPFQKPLIPAIAPNWDNLYQIHSDQYKNPQQLPEGAVLVVGAGSSGIQIAEELNRAGKKVYLSVGPHERPPRRYRGRDNVWWLGVLGIWDESRPSEGPIKGFAVSGADGGKSVDFRKLAHDGITLVGMTQQFSQQNGHNRVSFQDDLVRNVTSAEDNYLAFLETIDAYIADNGLNLPEDPTAKQLLPMPESMLHPLTELDLTASNVTAIVWASGFGFDYGWLDFDIYQPNGAPIHKRGVTPQHGIYFVGLPYLSGKGSSFIWGVWYDAKHIAEYIDIQNSYQKYIPPHHTV